MSNIELPSGMTLRECAAGSDPLSALWRDYLDGRMTQAVLFIGESGVGKRTFARLLAQALLCDSEKDAEKKPCGSCRGCRRFLARTHPDALFPAPLPKEKTIKIDALREMIDSLNRHSLEGGRRVVLIENAERMTPQAQNCLLKTLEDGAEDTYFILTCDAESALLPTIRSRCRIVRVQPWEAGRIEQALVKRGIPADRAKALSVFCEGSLGRALQMQDDASYWQARDTVKRSFLAVRGMGTLPAAAQALKDQKDNGDRLLDILEQEIRALLHAKSLGGDDRSDDFPPAWQEAPAASLCRILEAVLTARRQKYANVGWAALSEGLMQTISEETKTWQV